MNTHPSLAHIEDVLEVLEHTRQCFLVLDEHAEVIHANAFFCDYLGRTPETLNGNSVHELLPGFPAVKTGDVGLELTGIGDQGRNSFSISFFKEYRTSVNGASRGVPRRPL